MKSNEVIRDLMEKNDIRFNKFAEVIGLKPNALASRMKRGNFSTDILNQMLDAFGYKIVLVPKDTKLKDGWYEVEDSHPGPEGESDPEKV